MKEQPIWGMLLILFFIVFTQKIPLPLRFIWAYFLEITAYHAIDQFYVPAFSPSLSNVIAWSASNYFIWMSLIPVFLINTNEVVKKSLINLTKWFMVYCAVVLLLGTIPSVFTANTFDASLIACFILFWDLNPKRKWFAVLDWIGFLISIVAIIYTKGRDAELILFVSLTVYYLPKFFWRLVFPLGVFIGGMCSYFMYLGGVEPRFEMWESFLDWWAHYANIWIGAGIGSFEWVGPYLDPGQTFRNQHLGFYVMHNEWLQLLFESGIIGLVCGLIGYVIIASKLKGKEFATWMGIGAGMVWYYILHAWPVQLLAIILISRMGKKDE